MALRAVRRIAFFPPRGSHQKKSDVSEKRPYLMRSPNEPVGRRALPHDPPHFIGTSDAIFFITICCQPKGVNQLCHAKIAEKLLASARFYWDRHLWGVPLLLLMPGHLHLLATFGPDASMEKVIRNWKRYSASRVGIRWQRDFFDHRLRSDESFEENPLQVGTPFRGARRLSWIAGG